MTANEFRWGSLLRPEWTASSRSLLVRGFHTLLSDGSALRTNPLMIELSDARLAIYFGRIRFLENAKPLGIAVRAKRATDPLHAPDPVMELTQPQVAWTTLEPAFYALIATPHDAMHPNEAEARVEEATGLVAAIENRKLLLAEAFQIVVKPGLPDELTAQSASFLVPSSFEPAGVSDRRLAAIETVDAAIQGLDPAAKNRFLLSLRWLEKAITRGSVLHPTDVFLTYWIAIEALAMPETSDIRPLNEALGRVYGVDSAMAKVSLHIGKLYGIRGQIVHNGKRAQFDRVVLDYLEALYVDILFSELRLPSERRAQQMLNARDVEASVNSALL